MLVIQKIRFPTVFGNQIVRYSSRINFKYIFRAARYFSRKEKKKKAARQKQNDVLN